MNAMWAALFGAAFLTGAGLAMLAAFTAYIRWAGRRLRDDQSPLRNARRSSGGW